MRDSPGELHHLCEFQPEEENGTNSTNDQNDNGSCSEISYKSTLRPRDWQKNSSKSSLHCSDLRTESWHDAVKRKASLTGNNRVTPQDHPGADHTDYDLKLSSSTKEKERTVTDKIAFGQGCSTAMGNSCTPKPSQPIPEDTDARMPVESMGKTAPQPSQSIPEDIEARTPNFEYVLLYSSMSSAVIAVYRTACSVFTFTV